MLCELLVIQRRLAEAKLMYTDVVRSFSSGKNSMRDNLVTPSEFFELRSYEDLLDFELTEQLISVDHEIKRQKSLFVSQSVSQSIRMTDCFSK